MASSPNNYSFVMMTRQCAWRSRVSNNSTNELLVDTEASHDMATHKEMFEKMHRTDVEKVICGGGKVHTVCGAGIVVVQGDHGMVRLLNTLYNPAFKYNHFSGMNT
jgi:hypothetical protein